MKHLLTSCLALALPCLLAFHSAAQPSNAPLHYMIVVTGNELLEGIYADSHTAFLTRLLQPRGWQCVGSLSVADNTDDLLHALRFATTKAPFVLVTGGLGPTPNDITRDTLAQFTGVELKEDPNVLNILCQRLNQTEASLPQNLRRQCLVPINGHPLLNPNGTAVGLVFHTDAHAIIALPGPPNELRPMARDQLAPYLRTHFGGSLPGDSLTMRFAGVRQSFIDQEIDQHITLPPETTVTSDFDGNRVDFTFTLKGNSPRNRQSLRTLQTQLKHHLNDYTYSSHLSGQPSQSLEEQTALALANSNANLALADAGSHGTVAQGLCNLTTPIPVLAGSYTAPSEEAVARLLGIPAKNWNDWAPGPERVKGLALTAAAHSGAAWSVGIGEITPAVNETNHVWVAVRSPKAAWTIQQFHLPNWDRRQPHSVATEVLQSLRRQILSQIRTRPVEPR